MSYSELPIGFSFSLAQNPQALDQYAKLDETEKRAWVERAKNAQSKEEMHSLVDELSRQAESFTN